MISQTILQIQHKRILFMIFPQHISMVEIAEIEFHGRKVAFDPCQLVHVFPDEGMTRYQNLKDPEVIDSLKSLARMEYFFFGEN